MLHNTGPFGPNEVPINVNPQSNMTSMSGRMNIGNNINNLAKIPQQSPQAANTHFNIPDYPSYGLNMNPGLSPFQNFHHVGFQQNSMSQSSIHDSWQTNILPMNLNMQSEHSMLGFPQYGKPEVNEQSYNKSMLNVPQVPTKAFHKQMGMDVNYHYNLNPSYRPYADYNLDLSSKHKLDDVRQFIDPNIGKERLGMSPHYAEQIDLSNKQKMHNFPRPYLETQLKSLTQKHDSSSINNDFNAHLHRSKEKHLYYGNTDHVKSQMSLDNRYRDSELDLSKSLKHGNLNSGYQNVSTDLRFFKDHDLRPQSNESILPKFQQPNNLNPDFSNMDLRIYKNQDPSSSPQNLEKILTKPQQPENLNTSFQSVSSDLRFFKDKDIRPQRMVEDTLPKTPKTDNLSSTFTNSSDHRFSNQQETGAQSNEDTLSKFHQPETSLSSNSPNVHSDLKMLKDPDQRPQNLDKNLSHTQQPTNLVTNYQNINSDLRFYKDQDSRRRSLENTVKMIENILSHSSNSRKSQVNSYQSKSTDDNQNKNVLDKSEAKDSERDIEDKDTNNSSINGDDISSIENLSNSNKSDESDANTSNEMDIDNTNENEEMDIGDESNEESDPEDREDSTDQSSKVVSNTIIEEKVVADKSESDESSLEEDVKPTEKDLHDKLDQDYEKIDQNVVVKVEVMPSMVDMEHLNPFHRDVFGVQSEETEKHDIIDAETSITVAKEVIRNDAAIEGALFECPHCSLYFNHPKRFLIHTKWHTFGLTNDKRMELQKEKEMKKQMRKEARVVERMNQNEVMDANAPGRKFNCRDCDKVFVAKASLKNHRQRYHPTRIRDCKICGKTVLGWMALRTHMATHTCDSGYQCDRCPKRFKHPHSLAKHRDTHLEKTQACPQCPKKFGSVTLLNVHMKTHERALRGATFRCTYCGKGFFESYSLQVHERTHRNERPYLCEICNTSFGTNSSLKRHLKVSHSTSKPFECSTCHRSFISEAIRDRHTMRNHGNPEDFKFVCKQCPCKYLKLKDLRKHTYKVHPKGKRKKKNQSDSE